MAPSSIRAAKLALTLLFLLNLVELINGMKVSERNLHWRPGFWDAGTARVIATHVSSFITVLAQVLGPNLATRFSLCSSHRFALLGLTAGVIAGFLDGTDNASHELGRDESGSVADPLLSRRRSSHEGSSHPDGGVESLAELLTIFLGLKAPGRHKALMFTLRISFFIAIPQASRPLFATVILMALGAIVIGLSHSSLAITIGLIINTFGVSSNLSLLCFAANRLSSSEVGPALMSVALFESAGSLIGIPLIYPIYQWSIDEKTPFYAGGLLYVLCGVSANLSHTSISSYTYWKMKLTYAAIAVVVWRIFRESHQQETEA
ncbi:hypothetical protein FANTH_1919 [Fusarium anthophilum]|uniref:Uncharacterized protein n=1 Tax=Fusarium anthophilum TaxID=48485 RepID=A0A8H4ZVC2_9HYPO|nr:hypothetical protein FANTH_1919 [Fusarium anthophilum]